MVILGVCIVLIGVVFFLGFKSHEEVKRVVQEQYGEQQLMLARQAASAIAEFADERVTVIEILARERSGDTVENVTRSFKTIYTATGGFYSIEYINTSGVVVYGYPEERAPIGYNLYAENRSGMFDAARDTRETQICRPVPLFEGGLGTFIWVPLYKEDEFQGVILAIIKISTISDLFLVPLTENRTGEVYMIDGRGQLLYDGEAVVTGGVRGIVEEQKNGTEGTATYIDHTDKEHIVAYAPVRWRNQEWSVGITAPVSEVDLLIRSVYARQMIFMGAVIAIITGGSAGLILMFSRWNRTLEAEVKEKTRDLIRANEQLKELDKLKSDFVSMVSHELKTPLAAMKTAAQVLSVADAEDTKREMVSIILRNIERQTKLVTDLLDLSRIESGGMALKMERVSPGAVVADAVESVRHEAEEKGLTLKIELPESLPPVRGDREKLRQVVINLLDNAIKFTSRGVVCIKAREVNGDVEVRVSDTGMGIPEEEQNRVFDRFYQVGNPPQTGGTGLGLAICKGIIEAHGGRIWVESEPGRGSTFVFTVKKA